jgi:CYTH domain-containing protein
MAKITEIERRWLLKDVPALPYDKKVDIMQFYTEESFRYRREITLNSGESQYYKIRKTSVGHGTNEEELFECSSADFLKELGTAKKIIHKLRHVYSKDGVNFEVDFLHHPRLIILEVELEDLDQPLVLPQEIQDLVIMEITGFREFSNYNLCVPRK